MQKTIEIEIQGWSTYRNDQRVVLMVQRNQIGIRKRFASLQLDDMDDFVEFLIGGADHKVVAVFGIGIRRRDGVGLNRVGKVSDSPFDAAFCDAFR